MAQNPRIRANWTRTVLDYFRSALSATIYERVYARVPERSRQSIDKASTFDWLPAEHHMAIADALSAILGNDDAETQWRRMTGTSFDKPIFRPLFQGALSLFSASPITMARVLPAGWGLIAADAGVFTIEPGSTDHGVVCWSNIPRPILACPAFLAAWRGGLHAFIDVLGRAGEVRMDESKAESDRTVTYSLRWWLPDSARSAAPTAGALKS
jgi:hypothetical protein